MQIQVSALSTSKHRKSVDRDFRQTLHKKPHLKHRKCSLGVGGNRICTCNYTNCKAQRRNPILVWILKRYPKEQHDLQTLLSSQNLSSPHTQLSSSGEPGSFFWLKRGDHFSHWASTVPLTLSQQNELLLIQNISRKWPSQSLKLDAMLFHMVWKHLVLSFKISSNSCQISNLTICTAWLWATPEVNLNLGINIPSYFFHR